MAPTNRKSDIYQSLLELGWQPEKHYREYTLEELEAIAIEPSRSPLPPEAPGAPLSDMPDPEEMAGQRQNQPEEVIRVDSLGREWLQEEVRKPAYPKPRGRRVLKYLDEGVRQETVKTADGYVETFEVAGDRAGRSSEVKITLPSYQVGIYRDRRYPFKVHVYNDREGFDFFEVNDYWGGAELVPPSVKRIYIENELCYDMRSVIHTIQAEYRQLVLRNQGAAK